MSLSHDILWSIFMLNAIDSSKEKEKRLTTTRLSSQVCRLWRDLILKSPTIWGRLILISNQDKEEWIEEVLKRAGGSSFLWVQLKWNSPTRKSNLPALFVNICNRHWDRVQVLDIHINEWSKQYARLTLQCWKLVANPARSLRSVTICKAADSLPEDLFGNDAPLLTSIECVTHSLNHHYTFLSQIDSLYFQPQSIDNLLDILRWTPCLRILRLSSLHWPDHWPDYSSDDQCSRLASMSSYILPRLAEIDAMVSLKEFNALWSTRSRGPAACFTHHSMSCVGRTFDREDEQFGESLANFINHPHCNDNDSNNMRLSVIIAKEGLDISLESASRQVQLYFTIFDIPFNISEFILDRFMPHMANVVYFSFDYPIGTKDIGNIAQSCLAMTRVHTIPVSRGSLRWYNRVQRSGGLLFPHLKLMMWHKDIVRGVDIKDMTQFISRRIKAGWSLPTLSVEAYNNMKTVCDGLDKLHGLRITWCFNVHREKTPEQEYVCGESESLEW